MRIRPTAFTIGLIIRFFIAFFYIYTKFGIGSYPPFLLFQQFFLFCFEFFRCNCANIKKFFEFKDFICDRILMNNILYNHRIMPMSAEKINNQTTQAPTFNALFLISSMMLIISSLFEASNILTKLNGLSNGGFISIFTSSIYPLFSM